MVGCLFQREVLLLVTKEGVSDYEGEFNYFLNTEQAACIRARFHYQDSRRPFDHPVKPDDISTKMKSIGAEAESYLDLPRTRTWNLLMTTMIQR